MHVFKTAIAVVSWLFYPPPLYIARDQLIGDLLTYYFSACMSGYRKAFCEAEQRFLLLFPEKEDYH
jgi:hypothetical protein